jgi:hypothetical protein
MTNVQQAAVDFEVMPGWYTDPADEAQVRWWDGSVWTTEVAPDPTNIPARPTVPQIDAARSIVSSDNLTPSTTQPQRDATISPFPRAFAAEAVEFRGSANTFPIWLLAFSAFWEPALNWVGRYFLIGVEPLVAPFVGVVIAWLAMVGLAVVDRNRLRERGFDRTASPVWILVFAPLAYLIARSVQMGRQSVAPLVTYLAILAALLGLGFALTALVGFGPNSLYSPV